MIVDTEGAFLEPHPRCGRIQKTRQVNNRKTAIVPGSQNLARRLFIDLLSVRQ
jgi:hypothetical protein